MADIYADEGITGTKVAVRQGFQRTIRDCMDGQIDIILTKSVSRFSRNTVDTIQYVRMLKEKGIAVIFEKEGINTMTEQGEMMGFNGCLGNNYHPEDKSITVNEEEAETVRLIFELYLQGYGTYTIARQLTEMGRINKKGGTTWTDSGILGIIKNEKYKGDLLMKKTFTVEPYKLTFVMKGNGNTAIPNTKKNFKESAS